MKKLMGLFSIGALAVAGFTYNNNQNSNELNESAITEETKTETLDGQDSEPNEPNVTYEDYIDSYIRFQWVANIIDLPSDPSYKYFADQGTDKFVFMINDERTLYGYSTVDIYAIHNFEVTYEGRAEGYECKDENVDAGYMSLKELEYRSHNSNLMGPDNLFLFDGNWFGPNTEVYSMTIVNRVCN